MRILKFAAVATALSITFVSTAFADTATAKLGDGCMVTAQDTTFNDQPAVLFTATSSDGDRVDIHATDYSVKFLNNKKSAGMTQTMVRPGLTVQQLVTEKAYADDHDAKAGKDKEALRHGKTFFTIDTASK